MCLNDGIGVAGGGVGMGAQTINFETEGVKREYGRTVVFNF